MRFTIVPARASLQEVAMAICETAAAPSARAHHQVGAPTARNAAVLRTRAAASSQSTPARNRSVAVSWETSAQPKPLADAQKMEEPVAGEHGDEQPTERGGHGDHLSSDFHR